jgi:hypothetical protein
VLSLLWAGGILAASDGDPSSTTQPADDSLQERSTPELKMRGIVLPASWKAEPETRAAMHTDAEWHAPSGLTVFGAVYIHVFPFMGGKGLVSSVKKDYVKRQPGGKMISEWTDSSGRNWFEADATGTHTKGFVLADGHHAWFVYYRYGTGGRSPQEEITVADHAIDQVETISP